MTDRVVLGRDVKARTLRLVGGHLGRSLGLEE